MTAMFRYLPSLEKLKEDVNNLGVENIVKRYCGCEFLIGSSESLKFLYEQYDKVKEGKKDERIQNIDKSANS